MTSKSIIDIQEYYTLKIEDYFEPIQDDQNIINMKSKTYLENNVQKILELINNNTEKHVSTYDIFSQKIKLNRPFIYKTNNHKKIQCKTNFENIDVLIKEIFKDINRTQFYDPITKKFCKFSSGLIKRIDDNIRTETLYETLAKLKLEGDTYNEIPMIMKSLGKIKQNNNKLIKNNNTRPINNNNYASQLELLDPKPENTNAITADTQNKIKNLKLKQKINQISKLILHIIGSFLNYIFKTKEDYSICVKQVDLAKMNCTNCAKKPNPCITFNDLKFNDSRDSNNSTENTKQCIANIKKILYNYSLFFQSYSAELTELLQNSTDKYVNGIDSCICFGSDANQKKIIFTVSHLTHTIPETREIIDLGFAVNVFYVDEYDTPFSYYYIDYKKTEPITQNPLGSIQMSNIPNNITGSGGSRKKTKQKTKDKRQKTLKRKSKKQNSKNKK